MPRHRKRTDRVGVTNFRNVIYSLYGDDKNCFPVKKKLLQEYVDEKKSHVKTKTLIQYIQHIRAYNARLGHGRNDDVFIPIIEQVMDYDPSLEPGSSPLTERTVDENDVL